MAPLNIPGVQPTSKARDRQPSAKQQQLDQSAQEKEAARQVKLKKAELMKKHKEKAAAITAKEAAADEDANASEDEESEFQPDKQVAGDDDDDDDDSAGVSDPEMEITTTRIVPGKASKKTTKAPGATFRASVVPPPPKLKVPAVGAEEYDAGDEAEIEDDPLADEADFEGAFEGATKSKKTTNKGPTKALKRKHRAGDADLTIDTVRAAKSQKNKENETADSKIKLTTMFKPLKNIMKLAIAHYSCSIGTVCAFPDQEEEQQMVAAAWASACISKNVSMPFDPEHASLLTERGSTVRGQLKNYSRSIVEDIFKLRRYGSSEEDKAAKDAQQARAKELRNTGSYIYRDPAQRDGVYLNPAIFKIVCRMWYKDRNDDGPLYDLYFRNGLTLAGVAGICTVMENVIDEYATTGTWHVVPFTEAAYGARYSEHLDDLHDLQAQSPDFIKKWLRMLRSKARDLVPGLEEATGSRRLAREALKEAAAKLGDADLEDLGGDKAAAA